MFGGTKSAPKEPKQDPSKNISFNLEVDFSRNIALSRTASQLFALSYTLSSYLLLDSSLSAPPNYTYIANFIRINYLLVSIILILERLREIVAEAWETYKAQLE